MQEFCVWDPTQPIFSTDLHWDFELELTQILGLALGVTQILPFLGTNMLVHPMRNCGVGGLKPTRGPNANDFLSQWNIGLRVHLMRCFS